MMNLLLILFMFSSFAAPPSSRSCDYYYEVERDYKCGEHGYPLDFGHRLCEKYLTAQPNVSKSLRLWFPKVRYCLQVYLENNRGNFRGCQDLRRKALKSHTTCYEKTGFCDLSFSDKMTILRVTAMDLANLDILRMSFDIQRICSAKIL
jgi:hypothetical protein